MADNLDAILKDDPAPQATPPAPVTETKVETPPIEAAPAPEAPKPAEPPKQEAIPTPVALDWRDRMKAAEKRLAEVEAERQRPQVPSVQDDPEAFAQYMQQANTSTRFDISEAMATEKHGDAVVKAAMDWGMERSQQSPAFAAEYLKQKHPIDWAVRQHKRDKLMSEIGDDPDSWAEKRYLEKHPPTPIAPAIPQAAPQPIAHQPAPVPLPTRSLASATSAGGLQTPVIKSPNEVFKDAFS